ncbi:MAG: DUF2752 domain-containing protein [Synechococcaceae cyanobacterium SM2_3_1]|nr:DUF2752 domain-containing protein [Synechococcaceae cyanobacterium SM2_3_1]
MGRSHHFYRSRGLGLGLGAAPLSIAVFTSHGGHFPLPPCLFLSLSGIPCPTCGMTRSVVASVQGHWGEAVRYHAFGPLLLGALGLLMLHLSLELVQGQPLKWPLQAWWFRPLSLWILLLAYCGYYGIRLSTWLITTNLDLAQFYTPLGTSLRAMFQ